MRPKAVSPQGAAKTVGPYSHAMRVGDFLFTSGQIPLDPKSGELVSGGIDAQTERVLENIRVLLVDQGLDFCNVVKTTVFMTNLADFGAMNSIYAKYFQEPYPARSTIQVAALPRQAMVEIEIIAHFSTP